MILRIGQTAATVPSLREGDRHARGLPPDPPREMPDPRHGEKRDLRRGDRATVWREVRRNPGKRCYRHGQAQRRAEGRRAAAAVGPQKMTPGLWRIVAAIKGSDPDITLQAICDRLEAMRERTPRGRTSWQPSYVTMLLKRAERLGLLVSQMD